MLLNRLKKNFSRLQSYLKDGEVTCYRLYDRDIPEIPYIIDIYMDKAVVYERGNPRATPSPQKIEENRASILDALITLLGISAQNIFWKRREVQSGKAQYDTQGQINIFYTVKENGNLYKVNLSDYLDTGLFLDHRPLRSWLQRECSSKKVLNLFSYTASLSVASAVGGAIVTSVDLSKTYTQWARDNFELNNINPDLHNFYASDCLSFLQAERDKYDLIIIDPPSFSNSKKTPGIFDVQRDHLELISLSSNRLRPKGKIYFSNNLRSFKLDESIKQKYRVRDLSAKSIPPDFRDKKIHMLFELTLL